MAENFKSEISITESQMDIDHLLNGLMIINELKQELKQANLLFIPKLIEGKPYFEKETEDLFNDFKEIEAEDFKIDICTMDDNIQYIQQEAEEWWVKLGWFFLEVLVLEPFIQRVKDYIKKKFKKKRFIETNITVKKPDKTLEIHYKGQSDNFHEILSKIMEY